MKNLAAIYFNTLMDKTKVPFSIHLVFLFYLLIHCQLVNAQNENLGDKEDILPKIELKNGERVVFLGNSLMEYEQHSSYLEFVLATRFPDCRITFRNLGWSGDTVFGEARNYFTSPPTAFELLVQQLTAAKPTIVFLAYGAIESEVGVVGISRFDEGLNQLLDIIDNLGAKSVLLSPIPQFFGGTPEYLLLRNRNLELYAARMAQTASMRKIPFIDVFHPFLAFPDKEQISDNGIHLNDAGYYRLASTIESGLGFPPRTWNFQMDVSRKASKASVPLEIEKSDGKQGAIQFVVEDMVLPIPLPADRVVLKDNFRTVTFRGLKKGYYALRLNGTQVAAGSEKKWAEGIEISQYDPLVQSEQLKKTIIKKNEVFFQQYRPLNRTYIIGFRSYEQGRHLEGLKDLDLILAFLEAQITVLNQKEKFQYELFPIK